MQKHCKVILFLVDYCNLNLRLNQSVNMKCVDLIMLQKMCKRKANTFFLSLLRIDLFFLHFLHSSLFLKIKIHALSYV